MLTSYTKLNALAMRSEYAIFLYRYYTRSREINVLHVSLSEFSQTRM